MEGYSGGNNWPAPWPALRLATWNAASLFHDAAGKRLPRLALFDRLVAKCDVVAVQETHGCEVHFATFVPRALRTHMLFASGGPVKAVGGVALLVRRSLVGPHMEFRHSVFAQGRVQRLSLKGRGNTMHIWNLHNHDIADVPAIGNALRADVRQGEVDPLKNTTVILGT